jgi:predicted NAD/FAD-binding protein
VPITVDLGAQFFHPGPYPLYTALLTALGLYPTDAADPGGAHAFTASITLGAVAEPTPRFVSPILPGRAWPLLAPWNRPGLAAFAVAFAAAGRRERRRESWAPTLEDWLPTLGLSRDQWEGMLLPWAASLFSGSVDEARGMSARAAMIFAAKALPDRALDPILYYVVNAGMAEVLRRLVAQCATVDVLTGATVERVRREPQGTFTILCADGRTMAVDDLVFASSGPTTLRLLDGIPGAGPAHAALRRIEFRRSRLALHTDPVFAPASPWHRSFLNCAVDGDHCEASMWMAGVLTDPPAATTARLWKSWVTHRDAPAALVLHEADFMHMLPTPATIEAQDALRSLQGSGGIWFAGGYLHPNDSQETALRSALGAAIGLASASSRARSLLGAPAGAADD